VTIQKVSSKIVLLPRNPAKAVSQLPAALTQSGHSVSSSNRHKLQVEATGAVGNDQEEDILHAAFVNELRKTRKRPFSKISGGSLDESASVDAQTRNYLLYQYPLPQRVKFRLRSDTGVGAVVSRTIRAYGNLRKKALPQGSNKLGWSQQELKKQLLALESHTGGLRGEKEMARQSWIDWCEDENTTVGDITALLTEVFTQKGFDEKVPALCFQGRTKEELIEIVKVTENDDIEPLLREWLLSIEVVAPKASNG
jgi:hypothetical protein